jgi:hypothetical protein
MMMMIVEQSVEYELAREPKYWEKTFPSATLSTTNPNSLTRIEFAPPRWETGD